MTPSEPVCQGDPEVLTVSPFWYGGWGCQGLKHVDPLAGSWAHGGPSCSELGVGAPSPWLTPPRGSCLEPGPPLGLQLEPLRGDLARPGHLGPLQGEDED